MMNEELQTVVEVESEEALRARLDQESREIELEEQITSLKNELAIMKKLHGEACQGWSNWQQAAEKHLAALRFIYGLADGARSLVLSRDQLSGILRLIERSTRNELPEFDELPF
jgi:hypothetical protein